MIFLPLAETAVRGHKSGGIHGPDEAVPGQPAEPTEARRQRPTRPARCADGYYYGFLSATDRANDDAVSRSPHYRGFSQAPCIGPTALVELRRSSAAQIRPLRHECPIEASATARWHLSGFCRSCG